MSSRILCGLVLGCFLAAAWLAPDDPTSAQGVQRVPLGLTAQAQARGSVRVIVGVQVPFVAEGHLLGAEEVAGQRRAIQAALDTLAAQLPAHLRVARRFTTIPFLVVDVDLAGLQLLESLPSVASVEEDVALEFSSSSSVPLIEGPAAWAAGFTGNGQVVAVLDTGIDTTHPALSGKLVAEACFSNSSYCPGGTTESFAPGAGLPCAVLGCDHGTHVAGIATSRDATFKGVAPDAGLVSIQAASEGFLNCEPGEPCVVMHLADLLAGLQHILTLSESVNIAAVNIGAESGVAVGVLRGEAAREGRHF